MAIKFNLNAQKIFLGDKEVGWVYKDGKEVYRKSGSIPVRYVQVSSADFDSNGNYTGWWRYIILPEDKPSGYRITNSKVKGVATNGDYLTSTRDMFKYHGGLSLELDYLDTSNVTDMSYMFEDSQATSLDLSNFDTSNVTTMQSMFAHSEATTIDVSNFDTSNVTNMSLMFYYSPAPILDLSSFDTNNVTAMTSMFASSQATTGYARTKAEANRFNNTLNKPSTLTFVVHPSAPVVEYTVTFVDHDDTLIKEELVEEGSSATAPTNPTREGYTFDGWDKAFNVITSNLTVKAIYIEDEEPSGIPAYYVQVSSTDFNGSGYYTGTEEYIILPEDKTSGYRITSNVKGVATSGDYLTGAANMFNGHTGLDLEVDYLDTSNVTTMSSMFRGVKVTNLDVSNFNTSNVINMAGMFRNSLITTLDLSSFDTSNVVTMNLMFFSTQATTLDLSSFDTSNVTDMSSMFNGSQATILDLSSFDTSKVNSSNGMFGSSKATTGYARTQTDANKFNATITSRPSGLTFVVK